MFQGYRKAVTHNTAPARMRAPGRGGSALGGADDAPPTWICGHFLGVMASLAALAMRNLSTFLAGILIDSPVAGLRPMRALR